MNDRMLTESAHEDTTKKTFSRKYLTSTAESVSYAVAVRRVGALKLGSFSFL